MLVASVIFCYIPVQYNTVLKNTIVLSYNLLRLYLHPSSRGTEDGKKMGAGDPWRGLSMGVVYVGIRGRTKLTKEVNDSANS